MSCGQLPDDEVFSEITNRDEKELRQQLTRELPYWLAFDQLSGVGLGGKRLRMLFDHFLSIEAAWIASAAELRTLPWLKTEQIEQIVQKRKEVNFDQLLQTLEKTGV